MDFFDMSLRVWTPSLACPPLPQTPPPTARAPTIMEETLLLSSQMMRKHTATQSCGEPRPQGERRWKVSLHHHHKRNNSPTTTDTLHPATLTPKIFNFSTVATPRQGGEEWTLGCDLQKVASQTPMSSTYWFLSLSLLLTFPLNYDLQTRVSVCFQGGDTEMYIKRNLTCFCSCFWHVLEDMVCVPVSCITGAVTVAAL